MKKLLCNSWMLIFLSACVTINVYFPAAAAEKAADRIIEDVWGGGEGKKAPADKGAFYQPQTGSALQLVVEFFIPSAAAAAPNLDISSPAIARIRGTMRKRHQQLAPHYAAGSVGLTSNGELAVRDLKSIPLRSRSQVARLVADQSRDRSALYREIARANGHPEWEAQIRATFARRWVAKARRGWWYQNGGRWRQK